MIKQRISRGIKCGHSERVLLGFTLVLAPGWRGAVPQLTEHRLLLLLLLLFVGANEVHVESQTQPRPFG